ncbi:hypothetical protein D1164_21105 [Mariniphaga sediminis]|uniref:Uncharacterized protein n=2 Tax=Mariniphaga sediminis TaxID=1628158 RepID=A0A399CTH7_9BACT|nr:hypothetical protein D1164_21105 [Mariniphaga sediminis]
MEKLMWIFMYNQMQFYKIIIAILFCILCLVPNHMFSQNIPENIKTLMDTLPVLSNDHGDRELLYQYSVGDLSSLSDEDTRKVISGLKNRGVGVITFWKKGEKIDSHIQEGIRIARIQKELGLSVVIDATRLLYGFYDGTPATSHISDKGETFSDSSFAGHTMGCPFTLVSRIPVIEARIVAYAEAYKAAGIDIDIVTADWEIDGPMEWNDAWENSKSCVRCRENTSDINNFLLFQATLRSIRSRLMYESYTKPVLERFPDALITNYATYPHDGWRYWYDYFEYPQPELPHIKDQNALYRPWYDEFAETGFTLAMPVVYTWYPIFNWYPEYSGDYRWFYNMLKVGSNAGKSTPSGIPLATFVHWHTTAPPKNPDPGVKQMSRESYQELLWHLLLRGHDMLFSWCMQNELAVEMILLQDVYNKSLEYNKWFKIGQPVIFDVPANETTVISGIKLNNKVLVRRTDFKENNKPVMVKIDNVELKVPCKPGECQILRLE